MKSLLNSLKSPLIAFLFLSVGLILWYCAQGGLEAVTPIYLAILAILATLSGLCLRLSSTIDGTTDNEDKRLGLQAGEKSLVTLILVAILLSLKISLELLEAADWFLNERAKLVFQNIKSFILGAISLLILFAFMSTMLDVVKLMKSRVLTWRK